jgi:hypothetical protein
MAQVENLKKTANFIIHVFPMEIILSEIIYKYAVLLTSGLFIGFTKTHVHFCCICLYFPETCPLIIFQIMLGNLLMVLWFIAGRGVSGILMVTEHGQVLSISTSGR